MSFFKAVIDPFYHKTRKAILTTSLLNESFLTFFGLLPFILRKDLAATTFQISLFTMLRPAVSVFSFYWSSRLIRGKDNLRLNLVIAGLLARLPFLFFFFFDNIWYLIFASAIYMLFSRAAIPAWMEVLKLNLCDPSRKKLFSLGSTLGYIESTLLAFLIGTALDAQTILWKIFFVISTLLGMLGVFIQWRTPIRGEDSQIRSPSNKTPFQLFKPWKDCITLLKVRPDFARYQLGTMLNGFGIMLAIPALTIFYADSLNLTHTEMAVSRYIFMGLGFTLCSPIWARLLNRFDINLLTGIVCIGFGLFPLLVLSAGIAKEWIFLAFLFYGITQAGSHLIWNLSGTIFAKDSDSAPFSAINVAMVGLRGAVAPFLGGLLCHLTSPIFTILLGTFVCFIGSWNLFVKPKEKLILEKE